MIFINCRLKMFDEAGCEARVQNRMELSDEQVIQDKCVKADPVDVELGRE